jgi:hypothetical protein
MSNVIWPAVIGAISALSVSIIQFVVAPLVTQSDLKSATINLEKKIDETAPQWKIFDLISTDKIVKSKIIEGNWDICTLASVGSFHETQACMCQLLPNGRIWNLSISLDESVVGGQCVCQPACFNFPKSNKIIQ